MRVIFLGTGNACASGGRNAMAILLQTEDFGVLLDCGPTTLAALKKLGIASADIDAVLISHHHGDHFGGLPFIVLNERYASGPRRRDKPLTVLGPPGTETTVTAATRLFFPGIEPNPSALHYRDLDAGEYATVGPMTARPFEVDHFSSGTAFGYRVELDGRTVVFSGDTAWTDGLVRESADADLFICECSSFETPLERHTSHRELAAHRERLTARRTLLVHAGDDVLAHENELVFELARDGMEVTL